MADEGVGVHLDDADGVGEGVTDSRRAEANHLHGRKSCGIYQINNTHSITHTQ